MVDAQVRERPILFSGHLVRKILAGQKTQTRRPVKPQPAKVDSIAPWAYVGEAGAGAIGPCYREIVCPFGATGDRIYVRENWCAAYARGAWGTVFQADGAFEQGKRKHARGPYYNAEWDGPTEQVYKFRPSIHMPRWAARLLLDVTSVRVERLQGITEEDARAEGVEPARDVPFGFTSGLGVDPTTHRGAFAHSWDAIYSGAASWASNPWVWVVDFKRVEVPRV